MSAASQPNSYWPHDLFVLDAGLKYADDNGEFYNANVWLGVLNEKATLNDKSAIEWAADIELGGSYWDSEEYSDDLFYEIVGKLESYF